MKEQLSRTALIILIMVSITATAPFQLQTAQARSTQATLRSKALHPVVLVPGNGGNQLEARLNSDYEPSSLLCKAWHRRHDSKDDDGWYRIWFDPAVLVAPFTKCFSERMMLYYDPVVDDYRNSPGVETRVPHFGSTKSLRYLDPSLKHVSAYMAPLVESLEQIGYVDSQTLFGAPYDFRYGLAANGHPSRVGSQYLQDLKRLVEHATASNSGKPAIIVSHSLGGLLSLHLLLRNDLKWRRQFVKHLVALSTPWSGTVQEMLTFASGYTLGVPLVEPLLVREEQRSSESNLWLMPTPAVFGGTRPLVVTPNSSYTALDIERFLNDLGFGHSDRRYVDRILPLVKPLEAPLVPVTCVVGSGVRTPETLFYYGERGFNEQPEVVYGDGDGTVNMVSLLSLQKWWAGKTNQLLETIKLSKISHTGLLNDKVAIDHVLRVIEGINSGVENLIHTAR